MSWRTVVVTGCAKLDYKMDYLVVRKRDGINRVHLSEIAVLLVESTAVSLTTTLLAELTKKKIKTIFCDEKHNPNSELLPYYGSHDTSLKIRKQICWNQSLKDIVWQEIVSEKIRQQMLHLKERDCTDACVLLRGYLSEIEPGDPANREGHAAKIYFSSLFGLDFSRSADNLINAALNYGYGVILSCFNREITANGYLTQLGLFHDNMYNPFNFASDLMEPFRIMVDKKVYEMELLKFEHEEKMEVLDLLNKEVLLDGKRQYLSNAIKIYCKSVLEALNEQDVSLIRFYRDEL